MSTQSTPPHDNDDPRELSDDELLERLAECDPEEIPLAKRARRALGQDEEGSS